jgi:hypothetical protein
LKETRALFRSEQHFPSAVIDRGGSTGDDAPDLFARARARVEELLSTYQRPDLSSAREQAMLAFAEREAAKVGLTILPGIHPVAQGESLHNTVSR